MINENYDWRNDGFLDNEEHAAFIFSIHYSSFVSRLLRLHKHAFFDDADF